MGRLSRAAFAGASLLASSQAWAQSDAAKQFGARENIQQVSLAPDGKHVVALIAVQGRGNAAMVADPATGKTAYILRADGNPETLRSCDWASATRIVCTFTTSINLGERLGFSRMISLNSDGSGMKELSGRVGANALGIMQSGGRVIDWGPNGSDGSVLMTRDFVPEQTTGTHLAKSDEGRGVELVDATSLKRKLIERPRMNASEYISDGHGNVRVMGVEQTRAGGYLAGKIDYLYRTKDSRDWKPLGTLTYDGAGRFSGFNPYAVDPIADVVYGFDNQDGRKALFSLSLDGKLTRTLIRAHPQVDVDGLVQVGRQQRVVGVSYATDTRQVDYFDPQLEKLRTALGKALPGNPAVAILDASADENQLLIYTGSDTNPGYYYLFDKTSRHLAELFPARQQLASVKLATVKPVTYPAADGTSIPGYLTLPVGSTGKGLPAIVMPHGGPGARDEWGFDWLAQFFAARGYAVLQPNFRGSAGYGDAWFQKNGFQSWKTAIGDVDDAGRWLVAQGIAKPEKLAIVGWSYGGYAALQSAVLDPNLFKAIVAVAPVTDLESLRQEASGFTSADVVDRFIGHGQHVREGSPARNAERIKAPVLLFHGDIDQNVGVGESRLMRDKLRDAGRKVDYVEFKGLDHQLDDDNARIQLLDKADTFLRASLGL